jgi:hypothetical protein
MKKWVTASVAAITFAFAGLCLAQDPTPHGYMIANYQINDQNKDQIIMLVLRQRPHAKLEAIARAHRPAVLRYEMPFKQT